MPGAFNPLARVLIVGREGGSCFRCGLRVAHLEETGRGFKILGLTDYSIHHRRARGMGGSRDPQTSHPSNGLLLCGSGVTGCHGWVESHRSAARADGYLLESWQDPATTPIRLPLSAELVWLGTDHYLYEAPQEATA